jgi:hypothetical protein
VGRRKSWVLLTTILMVIVWFPVSYRIEEMVNYTQVTPVVLFGFTTALILAFQDVSMDG